MAWLLSATASRGFLNRLWEEFVDGQTSEGEVLHPGGLTNRRVLHRPIMPRIMAGIPSRTNPLTSRACSRMAFVSRGSLEGSVTTTPLVVSVSCLR